MKPLALTQGDPDGIGLEITISAWRARRNGLPPFFIICDPAALTATLGAGSHEAIRIVGSPSEVSECFRDVLPVLPVDNLPTSSPDIAAHDNRQRAVIRSIDKAVELVLAGEAGALVTNPISKERLQRAGFQYPGHTEYLGALSKAAGHDATPVMMLAGPELRTVPVTVHIPLHKVPEQLSTARIVTVATVTARAVRRYFNIPKPRLAITGLNPHAGEAGTMGREEIDIIIPAINELRQHGLNVSGPHPADTVFHARARKTYDVVIAMYHDQALIPVKTIGFDSTVNVTLGLPFIRTSPDHGTAFDIAGKGIARPDSLIAALQLAAQMCSSQ